MPIASMSNAVDPESASVTAMGYAPLQGSRRAVPIRPGSDSGEQDRLRSRLGQIVNLNHPLAKPGRSIDWLFIEQHRDATYTDGSGERRSRSSVRRAIAAGA